MKNPKPQENPERSVTIDLEDAVEETVGLLTLLGEKLQEAMEKENQEREAFGLQVLRYNTVERLRESYRVATGEIRTKCVILETYRHQMLALSEENRRLKARGKG